MKSTTDPELLRWLRKTAREDVRRRRRRRAVVSVVVFGLAAALFLFATGGCSRDAEAADGLSSERSVRMIRVGPRPSAPARVTFAPSPPRTSGPNRVR